MMFTQESSENPALRILEISVTSSGVIFRASSFLIELYSTPAASSGFVSSGWMCLQPAEKNASAAARERSARELDIVNALDVEDAGDALDGGENAFELFAVVDIERHFHARVQFFAAAFEGADIGARVADGAGDAGENAGAILG